jgi:hypothetical protein
MRILSSYRRRVDEARAVIDRLERIELLERDGAPPAVMLEELRGLVREAEVWARLEGDERARVAVDTYGSRLASVSTVDGTAGEANGS